MTLTLLIACMHEKDTSIIQRSNAQTDVVVVNQCDRDSVEEFNFVNKFGRTCHAKYINTTERGLSRSRNMAIRNAWGDVCLICDDDEWLEDDCEEKILKAYKEEPEAGLIVFALIRKDLTKSYPVGKKSLGFKQILKTSSQQVTFSRNLLGEYGISFDEKMGSGTGNGGGEENKFMLDWRRAGAKMLYYPDIIATVNPGESQWFKGYTPEFMRNMGWSTRRSMGSVVGFLYVVSFAVRHVHLYGENMSFMTCLKNILNGYFEHR